LTTATGKQTVSWQRTHDCGAIRAENAGDIITVNGWANTIRDHGGVTFIDLRDRTGLVQIVIDPSRDVTGPEAHTEAQKARTETSLSIRGRVAKRPDGLANANLATGQVEIEAIEVIILNTAKPLPFPLDQPTLTVNEETRLKYRYLDLRRPAMFEKMRLRHEVVKRIREYFYAHNFLEIETPILTKSSPEGARDYLVPYRLEPGKFYALPQAPQQFKQLLMVGGIERYFQIAKCFRDESQRADRQPEFTQVDLEMSYVTQEDVLNLVEGLMLDVVNHFVPQTGKEMMHTVFPRFTYDEAIARFGSDKPDIRFGLELIDCTPIFSQTEFAVFKQVIESKGQIKAIRYPKGTSIPRREMDELVAFSREAGAKGMSYLLVEDDGKSVRGTIAKFVSDTERDAVLSAASAEPGDLIAFIADEKETVAKVLDRLRRLIGSKTGLIDKTKLAYCWIVDFPVFDKDEETGKMTFAHNPFAMPRPADVDKFDTDPLGMRAQCYDLVCNGYECASGSVRIHIPELQIKVFEKLGLNPQQVQDRFGHMLEAFSFGAPPHAGIAPGLDRLIMLLCDEENIREVTAFPKMGGGYDPMMDAPSFIEQAQLDETGLMVKPTEKEAKQG
jgi:aspartyl-tRNA synthetase